MLKIEQIEEKLYLNSSLDYNIGLVVMQAICNKELTFEKFNDEINLDILIQENILKQKGDKYIIDDYSLFAYKFFQIYKVRLNIELNGDFTNTTKKLNEIELDFKADKFIQEVFNLIKALWITAIIESNNKHKTDFVFYLNQLNFETDKNEIFLFNESYCNSLLLIEIDVEAFYNNAKQLIEWNKSDVDFNMPLNILLKGIRDKIYYNISFGVDFFEYTLKQEPVNTTVLIPVLTGLYDNWGLELYKQKTEALIYNETYSVSIICGLSNINSIYEIDAEYLLDIYNKINKENLEILINLPKLLFAIIKSDKIEQKSNTISICFSHLDTILSINNQNLISSILRGLDFYDIYIEERFNLILKLIKKTHFNAEKYLGSINYIIWSIKNISYFEKLLFSLAENCSFQPISKLLNSSIHEYSKNNKKEFDKIIISFLIDNNASFRFLGLDIFNEISHNSYSFDYDILNLEPINQYKLWVTLCQSYRQPENIIPCLLPLFKSKSAIVREAFICKLEEYTENYGSDLTEILKSKIDFNNHELKEIYDRIELYRVNYQNDYVLIKQNIKELNPVFTQNKLFIEFNKNHNRVFSRQLQKSTNENSFFHHLCSTVNLLKGGGWKIDGKDEITKLGKIGHKISLPRNYFIQPELIDYEYNIENSRNWDENSFSEIIKHINNE